MIRMTLAYRLERLARLVPGIGGYQDREAARDSDKAVRVKVAEALEDLCRELERDKRRLVEARALDPLPKLDLATSKLARLGNTIRYAERGYRGVFGGKEPLQPKLDALCDFDLALVEETERLREAAAPVHGAEPGALPAALEAFHAAIDGFEKTLDERARRLD